MRSFFDHVPERFHAPLREAIEAVTESKHLLDQVQARFGTREPAELEALVGRTFDGVTVTPDAVAELAALVEAHEARRAECRDLLERAARGGAAPHAQPAGEEAP